MLAICRRHWKSVASRGVMAPAVMVIQMLVSRCCLNKIVLTVKANSICIYVLLIWKQNCFTWFRVEQDRYLLFPNFSVNFLFYWHKYSENSSTRNWDTRNRSSEPGTVASVLIITSQFSSFFDISLKNSLDVTLICLPRSRSPNLGAPAVTRH